jgi:hypothetical protein
MTGLPTPPTDNELSTNSTTTTEPAPQSYGRFRAYSG